VDLGKEKPNRTTKEKYVASPPSKATKFYKYECISATGNRFGKKRSSSSSNKKEHTLSTPQRNFFKEY